MNTGAAMFALGFVLGIVGFVLLIWSVDQWWARVDYEADQEARRRIAEALKRKGQK